MPRNFLIQIKVSEQEKAQVKADATRMKQNVSDYARSLLLHEKSPQPSEREKSLTGVSHEPGVTVPHTPSAIPPPDPPRQTEADEVEAFKQPDIETRAKRSDDPKVQAAVHDEFIHLSEEQEYERRVNRHALRMPRRKAEAIVKKEMGLDG